MKLAHSIENVTFPISKLNDKLFIIGINNYFGLFDGRKIIDFKNVKIKESGFLKIENKLYFYSEKKIICTDLETLEASLFLEFSCDEIWLLNDKFYFYANKTKERREYKFDYFSSIENKILWSTTDKLELTNLSRKYLVFTNLNRTVYVRYDNDSGEKIWTLDFSENRINGNVLLIKKVLVFPTTSQDLIGIEIETGKELWRLQNINAGFFQIQPKTNYLISLNANSAGDNWYYVINPLNGEIIIYKKFDNFFYDAMGSRACITETHYYFISNVVGDGHQKDERITHMGCINLQTHEIEWVEKVGATSDRRSEYQKPEINNNKIYLLDGEQTLHIYDLEI